MRPTALISVPSLGTLLLAVSLVGPAQAFRNYDVGDTLPQVKLPTLDGKKHSLIATQQKISVFYFFRPDQQNSLQALKQIAECQAKFKDSSVFWVGVVSDHYSVKASRLAISAAGIKGGVLIDKGDAVYGQLGVKLHPVVGIADGKRNLKAYLPFRKINYCVVIAAHIRHALGDIDDQQLELALNPPKATQGGDQAKAMRNLKFAAMMLKADKPDKAMGLVDKALQMSPDLATAHALKGAILVAQGDCETALGSLAKALTMDPTNARALEGQASCAGSTSAPAEHKQGSSPTPKPAADN